MKQQRHIPMTRMPIIFGFILLSVSILFTGCDVSDSSEEFEFTENPFEFNSLPEQYPPPDQHLTVELLDPPDPIRRGETVEFSLRLTNTSDQDLFFESGGRTGMNWGLYDFLVTGPEDEVVWRFHKFVQEALLQIRMNAGESVVLSHEWDGKGLIDWSSSEPFAHQPDYLNPGTYKVSAIYNIWGLR
ncbi:MAG: BsuPI-related putative proteinase inhibitor [Balneolaceae bacterium]